MENGRYKILYFEDDEVLVQMFKTKLEQAGFLVAHYDHTTTDPVSLVIREKPDLILMDVIMPGMDGFEATERLQRHHMTKHIPIFGFDNLSQPADIKKAHDVGMVDYWVKANHMPSEVVDKIKSLLNIK